MDSLIVNRIIELLPNIKVYGTPDDINSEILLIEEIVNLFGKLTKKKFKEFESYSYLPHRHLGRLLFTSNKYDKALYHLEIATKLFKEYGDIDSYNNNANSKRMIARCMIDIGLRDNDNYSIKTAKKILENLLSNEIHISIKSIIDETNNDLAIVDGIENNDIKTIMEFTLPFPIKLLNELEVEYLYDDIKCCIKSTLIQSQLCPFESNSFIEMKQDKHGISMHSNVQITVGKYIEPRHPIMISELTGETAFKPLVFAINALNEFRGLGDVSRGLGDVSSVII